MADRMTPPDRPTIARSEANAIASAYKIDTSKPYLLGRRGHWQNTLGKWGVNDRGIYDDAIFLITPDRITGFIANTDPSKHRYGRGKGSGKGMAVLAVGCWDYQLGMHRGKYQALVQAGEVMVIRDGTPDYPDTGWFGINIHMGNYKSTSSLGCQTIHPNQWKDFMDKVKKAMAEAGIKHIKYCLTEGQGK